MSRGPRVELEPAYLLHRRAFRETSLLAEAFTRDHGRIGLVARGARRGRSPAAATLQAFRPLLLSWTGRGDLRTLTGVESASTALAELTGRALLSGFYLNELILRLVQRHDPNPNLFAAYTGALDGLRSGGEVEPVLRVFEKRLLDALGYGLPLEVEADTGRPVSPDRRYRYDPQQGALAADGAARPGYLVSGLTLIALAREHLEHPVAMREAKRLMRAALAPHLGDAPLRSRELFVAAGREEGTPAADPAAG